MGQFPKAERVLIVEDEFLVAMHLESVLGDLGFSEILWANDLPAAERHLESDPPAFAILDINIGQKLVYPIAVHLRDKGIPFLFSSGGGSPAPEWAEYPFVPKPLDPVALRTALHDLDIALPTPVQTLGDVLYADSRLAPPEHEWFSLLQQVAGGDQLALHRLYERAHRPVLMLLACFAAPADAEDLAIEVFHEVFRSAADYDEQTGSVLGWVMNIARKCALARCHITGPGLPLKATTSPGDAAMLQARLSMRIAVESGLQPVMPPAHTWREPVWEAVAPGIECKLLAADRAKERISMLVRLAPNANYPAHTHAGVEELHLLEGELWIDDRKLYPGDYNYGAPGAGDDRVWSETGCSCVLVTSTQDVLR